MTIFKADYVIVGAGTAGGVIANLLTEDCCHSAIAIEAGANENNDPVILNPLEANNLVPLHFPEYFFQGKTVAQDEVDDRSFDWTDGRMWGGGSGVNGMQQVEGTRFFWSQVEAIVGPLWGPDNVFANYRKIETYNGQSNAPRGMNGPLDVRQAPVNPTAMAMKLSTAVTAQLGFPEILDYNDPDTPIGPFTRYQLAQTPSRIRAFTGNAFLDNDVVDVNGNGVKGRKLKIISRATGIRLLFSCKDPYKAIGVEYTQKGKCFKLIAKKKVFVCAGFRSTQLLLQAGIGPAAMLKELGIKVRFDNPNVGNRLQNHPGCTATFVSNPADNGLPPGDPQALYVGGAMLPNPTAGSPQDVRSIQTINISPFNGLLLIVGILDNPVSTGTTRVQSCDPLQVALGDPNYLGNPDDLTTIIDFFRNYIKPINQYLLMNEPGYALVNPPVAVIDDDDAITAFVRATLTQAHHWVGGCCMGPLDEGGVTDSTGHVHGIKNLIVADNSILPLIPDGNTAGPAYLIGWIIGNLIRGKCKVKLDCDRHCCAYLKCRDDDWKDDKKDCDCRRKDCCDKKRDSCCKKRDDWKDDCCSKKKDFCPKCDDDWFKQWECYDDVKTTYHFIRKDNFAFTKKHPDQGYRQKGEEHFGLHDGQIYLKKFCF